MVTTLLAVSAFGRVPVSSVEDAAARWNEFRARSLAGCSEIGNGCSVYDARGALIARISYNGRIWPAPAHPDYSAIDELLAREARREFPQPDLTPMPAEF